MSTNKKKDKTLLSRVQTSRGVRHEWFVSHASGCVDVCAHSEHSRHTIVANAASVRAVRSVWTDRCCLRCAHASWRPIPSHYLSWFNFMKLIECCGTLNILIITINVKGKTRGVKYHSKSTTTDEHRAWWFACSA